MRGTTRARLVGVAMTAALAVVGAAVPAYSAPEDGTTGSEQPSKPDNGTKPTKPTDPKQTDPRPTDPVTPVEPEPEKDTEAPAAPVLGPIVVQPEGLVELPVTAEAASSVVVRESVDGAEKVVVRGTGTGQAQTFTWTTKDGPHTYSVTATDKEKNESPAATITVDVDAKAPKVKRFRTVAGTAEDTRSTVEIRTEPEAAFRLLVDDEVVKEGVTDDGDITQVLELEDGRHDVTVELEDEVGNARTATRTFRLRIPELQVDAELLSDVTDPLQVVRVEAMAGTRGVLEIPGELQRKFRLPKGKAEIELTLEDGVHEDVTVTVRDGQGRTGTVNLRDITVDTTAPELAVDVDRRAAAEGRLAMDVAADEDTVVTWSLTGAGDEVVATGKYVALGGEQRIERDVPEGSFELEVTATDTYGRTTVERVNAPVAADPMSLGTVVLLGLLFLALVVAAVLGAAAYRRHRRRTLGAQARTRKPREGRKAKAKVAETSREEIAAFEVADEAWRRRHDVLATLIDVANGRVPESLPTIADVALLPDERVIYTVPAELTDLMDSDRLDVALGVDGGELVVTTHRFAFLGAQRRDWWYPLIERVRHKDHRHTTIKLRDSDTRSGLEYDDPEVTRLYLDLAMSGQNGTRVTYVAGLVQGLRDHEMRRPTPPGHERVPA